MGRVWGYARGSVLPDFATVEAQRQLISDYAASQLANHEFMGVTVDDLLGARQIRFLERPQAAALNLQMARGDHLVVASMDRGWRRMDDFLSCVSMWQDRGIELHVLDHGIHTDVIGTLWAVQRDTLEWVDRWLKLVHTEQNKEARAMAGHLTEPYYVRHALGWRYKAVGGAAGRPKLKLVKDEKERALMREFVEKVDGGWTWREIAQDLAKRRIKKRMRDGRKKAWTQWMIGYAYRVAKGLIAKGEL